MDSAQEQKVLEALYDRLFQAVTYAPAGGPSGYNAATTFIQFAKNLAINPADFANQVTPNNPKGDLNTSENFARFVDVLPAIDSNWSPTAGLVSQTYGNIVNGANTAATTDPAQQNLYNQAFNYLNSSVTIKDFTGKETTSYQPSTLYTAYNNNQQAYIAAVCAYSNAYNSYDLTKISDQRAWQANEPMLQNAVTNSYNTWRAQGATQVEQALNALASSINNSISAAIAQAQQTYTNGKMASSMGKPLPWFLTFPFPTNWYDVAGNANFSAFSLKSDNLTTTSNTNYTDYSAGGSASYGLWSVSAGVSGHHDDEHYHMDADTFQLSAKIGIVSINRPWLNDLLFKMQNWYINSANKNGISNGALANNQNGLLPLIPTAFIVATDVSITANFSSEDKSHVADSISTKASVGWGPFAVNGSYSSGSSSDYFNSTFNGGTLNIPGMQIIAWVNEIVPASAPLNSNGQ